VDPFGLIALLIPYAGMFTGVVFMMIVYKLVARWQDGSKLSGRDEIVADIARLRADLESIADVSDQVQEIEERLDFAERMLAQQKRDSLPTGG